MDEGAERIERFLATHPDLDGPTREAIRGAPPEVFDAEGRLVPYDPAGYPWSAGECFQNDPEMCRKCYEPRPYGGGQKHFGWTFWRVCPLGCSCAHHRTEVWVSVAGEEQE